MKVIPVKTGRRNEIINITPLVEKEIGSMEDGVVMVFVPHTTAGITINESADPHVREDILFMLEKLVPDHPAFKHAEGNSDAHVKATLTGFSQLLMVEKGRLVLGTWQALYFCEFDGPRNRKIYLKTIAK